MKVMVARVTLEARTPFTIGSGEGDVESDIHLLKDANGLPYLPGTSLAGYLRSLLEPEQANILFGPETQKKSDVSEASRIIVSDGLLHGKNDEPVEGLLNQLDSLLQKISTEIVRDRVRIDTKTGAAEDTGKFSISVAPKGCRFTFELRTDARQETEDNLSSLWDDLLTKLKSSEHRLGASKASGLGVFKVHSLETRTFDLEKDFDAFLNLSPSLKASIGGNFEEISQQQNKKEFELALEPESTWIFGQTGKDKHADLSFYIEKTVNYDTKDLQEKVMVPGSSIRGPLWHRTFFHYCRKKGITAESYFADETAFKEKKLPEIEKALGTLFGTAHDEKNADSGCISQIFFRDIEVGKPPSLDEICESREGNLTSKIFNHVKIDRFTGGAVDQALFSERVLYKGGPLRLQMQYVPRREIDEDVKEAFIESLRDLADGMLPLGASSAKGHGFFTAKFNEEEARQWLS